MPKIQWTDLPLALRDHLFDRVRARKITADDLYQLKLWRESEPEAPEGLWYKDFGTFKVCGEGKYPKTFLLRGQVAKGRTTATAASTPIATATAPPAPTRTATVSTPATTAPPTTTATAASTPVATATALPTGSATAIETMRTPVASPTPSPTVTPGGCPGDCDGDGGVTVDELITGVSIALGAIGLDQCLAFDTDAGGTVTVNELIAAIDSALNGCD